jgi:thioredoxin 1
VNLSRNEAAPAVTDVTERSFDEALTASDSLMMVDFWAPWCAPCRAIAPLLEELAEASAGRVSLLKVNVDENPGLAARYHVRSIPTVLFVKSGRVVDQVAGAAPKAVLQTIVAARA